MDRYPKKMTSQQIELYQRIQAFSLDQPNAQLSFNKRLAKDNRWSLDYTKRVVEEYKKFTFLAVAAGHPVAPSDPVDQVWHLHLSYTRPYWQEFCPNVLQAPLHHSPSLGGLSEQLKFKDWYCQTLESYRQFFGQMPPNDIWPSPEDRFGRDRKFARVSIQENWIVPKLFVSCFPKEQPKQAVILCFLFILGFTVAGCQIVSGISNSSSFDSSKFLNFYYFLSIVVVFLARGLRYYLRLPADKLMQQPLHLNAYEAAYLAAGKNRVVETAIVSLAQKEIITVNYECLYIYEESIEELSDPMERELAIALASGSQIDEVREEDFQTIDVIQTQLCEWGLLVNSTQSVKARTYPVFLIVGMLGLWGFAILVVLFGQKSVEPNFLPQTVTILGVIGYCFWHTPIHRSRQGDRILQELRNYVPSAPTNSNPQLPLAFAVWGTSVISNNMFNGLAKNFISGDDGACGCG